MLCLFCRFGCCMLWYLRVLCNLVFMVFGCWLVVVTWLLACGLRAYGVDRLSVVGSGRFGFAGGLIVWFY